MVGRGCGLFKIKLSGQREREIYVFDFQYSAALVGSDIHLLTGNFYLKQTLSFGNSNSIVNL